MTCIFLNSFLLCIKWYGMSERVTRATETLNHVFSVIFTLEIIVKLSAQGKYFWKDGWNQFDSMIVAGTIIGFFLTHLTDIDINSSSMVIRAFRLGRMLRLFRRMRSLKLIFQTFMLTIPAIQNVGFLLCLLLYIYSVLGMQLFQEVKRNGPLDHHINFSTIGYAFLTMFRVSTGEAWHDLMNALTRPADFYLSY